MCVRQRGVVIRGWWWGGGCVHVYSACLSDVLWRVHVVVGEAGGHAVSLTLTSDAWAAWCITADPSVCPVYMHSSLESVRVVLVVFGKPTI